MDDADVFSPPLGPPPGPLVPPGWKATWDDHYREWFYTNLATKEATWTKPDQTQSSFQPVLVPRSTGPASTISSGNNTIHSQQEQPGHRQESDMDRTERERRLLENYKSLGSTSEVLLTGPNKQIAWSLVKSCRVMIKRYNNSYENEIAAARRELKALRELSDASIPPLIECFDPANTIWLVTEDRKDESLRKYIEGRGSLSGDLLKALITQLFSAITVIFMHGFAHLRICDETLFLDDNGQLTIKDFQYAHKYGTEKVDGQYALTDAKYGSDIFVAPEVFSVNNYNARKAVMWSCGVVVYYMVTGQTERLSNLEHPALENTDPEAASAPETRRMSFGRRRSSQGGRKLSLSNPPGVVTYPGTSRLEIPAYTRDIVSKMLIRDPSRRAELIEVAAKVPKELATKDTRPLMELAWLDYKSHVGPMAGLENVAELDSSASSMFSGISNMSNPFASLMSGRRRSSARG